MLGLPDLLPERLREPVGLLLGLPLHLELLLEPVDGDLVVVDQGLQPELVNLERLPLVQELLLLRLELRDDLRQALELLLELAVPGVLLLLRGHLYKRPAELFVLLPVAEDGLVGVLEPFLQERTALRLNFVSLLQQSVLVLRYSEFVFKNSDVVLKIAVLIECSLEFHVLIANVLLLLFLLFDFFHNFLRLMQLFRHLVQF